MRLEWNTEALAALRSIITRRNAFASGAGTRIGGELRDAARRATERPLAGRMVPEFGLPNMRERIVREYRLIYGVFDDRIEVIGIVHGARDLRGDAEDVRQD